MYFDQNILKILYTIPDDTDISEIQDLYLASCMSSALEALEVYKQLDNSTSDNFLDNSTKFESLFERNEDESEERDLDLEFAQEILEKLRLDAQFNELYQSYIDAINTELYEHAVKNDPEVLDDLEKYLKQVKDAHTVEYFNRFVKPGMDIVNEEASDQSE